MLGLKAIESYFNMSFSDVINKLHLEEKITILELSRRCGISRDTFQKQAKKHGLKVRNPKEARQIVSEKGICSKENHWAWGLTKENSAWARIVSENMKRINPSNDFNIRCKMSNSLSKLYKNNPLPQEKMAANFLDKLCVKYEFQKPVDTFIIDFFLLDSNICLEVDSTDKWGRERNEMARKRDEKILALGFKTIRLNKKYLSLEFMHDVLAANDVI